MTNKALHRTAIPLRFIAIGELGRWAARRVMKEGLYILLVLPAVAHAEVSDKMASIPNLLVIGVVLGAVGFSLAYWRWWLVIVGLALFILSGMGSLSLWNDVHMRSALLHEQGWPYFAAQGFYDLFILAATVIGAFLGRRRHAPNKALEATRQSRAPQR